MKRALLILFLLCLPVCVRANGGEYDRPIPNPGDAAPMIRPTTVRMVRERIDIKLSKDGENALVHCLIMFKNEGPATTVRMGFPEENEESRPDSVFTSFKTWVDGKQMKSVYIPGKRPYIHLKLDYINWHVLQDIHFDANQTRTVVFQYVTRDPSNYILRTGGDWKGNIDESVIRVEVPDFAAQYQRIHATPHTGCSIRGNVITWRFTNFKPTEDVHWEIEEQQVWYGPIDVDDHPCYIGAYKTVGKRIVLMTDASEMLDHLGMIVPDGVLHKATFRIGKKSLTVREGSRKAVLDGSKTVYLDCAPEISTSDEGENILEVPVFSIVKALGCKVVYDPTHFCYIIKWPPGFKPKVD